MSQNVYILHGARAPMGEYGRKLRAFSEIELGVMAARAALTRAVVDPAQIDHTVIGNVTQSSSSGISAGRYGNSPGLDAAAGAAATEEVARPSDGLHRRRSRHHHDRGSGIVWISARSA